MVRDGHAGPERGFFRVLSGGGDDDAQRFVDAAAEALLIGVADPIGLLGRGGDDWTIAAAVVSRARKIHAERRSEELNALAKAIGGHCANALAQMLR